MVLNVFIVAVIIFALILVLFFLFSILLPAMKKVSFPVDMPLFSDSELHIRGVSLDDAKVSDMRAVVACTSCIECEEDAIQFNKTHSCRTVHEVCISPSDCDMMCVGFGDCISHCKQGAITIQKCGKRNIAVVTNLCCGCGECVSACPQHAIKMVRRDDISTPCAASHTQSGGQTIQINPPHSNIFSLLTGNA